ncbi:Uroporphyrinogen decarboxylase (URO-D) [Sporobacter termitidis DSM 10068]|uniref:Uroporphyrinogen decarboxylase (URO-D) n=1 Tax=Sporobacter termitidis DSM 10068 TaxID=1123282 RepID=A0A1M5X5L5_9FIRM|nr:uroporphyrinogen decarboxylase family protein [Sporobacter termitidis]SHH95101.1 Uroporphyrinogen decarboxylase (URO-D) [Sporobacter termitidis DSM 10068]
MKYERPSFRAPGVPTERKKLLFLSEETDVPKFDYPVTPLENFRLAAAHKTPYWMPNSMTDDQFVAAQELVTGDVRGMQVSADFTRVVTESYTFKDWFNTDWTWVPSAGGPMLTPGTCLCQDITAWEKTVKFPELREWDFTTFADSFMKTVYDPAKVLHIDLGQGATERLISIVGGYTEGMLALAMEPDAVRDFLNRFADFTIEYVDLVTSLYPVNMITYHDDWGTEKDTFFSEKMMEEIVFGPTKRIIDHIRSKGVLFEFHCCGNITRFIPYMIGLQVDFLQIQRRAVDIPAMKKKYGDRIGFNVWPEALEFGVPHPKDELVQKLRNTVDLYGTGGGAYVNIMESDPVLIWDMVSELYAYSREFYDSER